MYLCFFNDKNIRMSSSFSNNNDNDQKQNKRNEIIAEKQGNPQIMGIITQTNDRNNFERNY